MVVPAVRFRTPGVAPSPTVKDVTPLAVASENVTAAPFVTTSALAWRAFGANTTVPPAATRTDSAEPVPWRVLTPEPASTRRPCWPGMSLKSCRMWAS